MEHLQAPLADKSSALCASTQRPIFTSRQSRVLSALVKSAGWISREDIDRIAGASNGPQIISELRRKVTGRDGIEVRRVDTLDRDGKPCRPGQYRLTEMGHSRLMKLELACHRSEAES